MYRYKLKGIVNNLNLAHGDYRKFKLSQQANIDELGFMMLKLEKKEANSNAEDMLEEYIRREILNTDIQFNQKQQKKVIRLNKAAEPRLNYSGKDAAVIY